MARLLFAIVMCLSAIPAAAQTSRGELIDDFTTFSMLMVANNNCPGLYFNPDRLKQNIARVGGELNWTRRELRLRSNAVVEESTARLGKDPAGFCREVGRVVNVEDPRTLAKFGFQHP
jgi:hypothetical protein